MEKWGGNITNIFFLKLSLITVFDEKKYCSKQSSKIVMVYSFWDFIIQPKWNISKNVSITFKLSKKRINWKFHILRSFFRSDTLLASFILFIICNLIYEKLILKFMGIKVIYQATILIGSKFAPILSKMSFQ